MDRTADDILRRQLVHLLRGEGAHVNFERAISGLPAALRGRRPEGQPHTPWRLLEHLRIALWDILEFSRNPSHVSPDWPEGYWPEGDAPPDGGAWERSVADFRSDLAAMIELVEDPANDLAATIPWTESATLLREALLVADHNAYHVGQLVTLRQLLGAWPP